MKRKNLKIVVSAIATMLAIQSPLSVLGAETYEFLQEEMLPGTAESVLDEEFLAGTADETERAGEMVVSDAQKQDGITIYQPAFEGLNKAENYLQTAVTNPIVDSIGGEWAVIAMARNGNLNNAAKNNYLQNIYQKLRETSGVLHTTKYTEYSRVALALTAMGINPRSVEEYNLLQPLANMKKVNRQGINGTIFALIAFDSNQYEIPQIEGSGTQTTRESLIQTILSSEISGGGWALMGNQPDPDITAMALQALAPYTQQQKVKEAVDRGIEMLAKLQDVEGGYISNAGYDSAKNLESTAQVVIALSAIDVSLLNSEKFIKNGKTLLDEMLRFQVSDGSFCHVIDGGSNQMATEQGALALAAWYRAVTGRNSLYDMTDVENGQTGGEETPERIEAFRKKLEAFSGNLTLDNAHELYALKVELSLMGNFSEKKAFETKLEQMLKEVETQAAEIEALDKEIWEGFDPLNITLKDKKEIERLLTAYYKIPEANRKHLQYEEELLRADSIIKKLEQEVIGAEIFENVKNSKKDYTYQGNGYTICLKGKNVYEPADMKAGIEIREQKNSLEFETKETGAFPGEVEIAIDTALKESVYMLYYEKDGKQQEKQWVSVNNGQVVCDIEIGGKYILKKPKTESETALSQAGSNSENKTTAKSKTANTAKQTNTSSASNTIQATVKDGMVEKKAFEEIKGKDKNLKIEGEMKKDSPYTITVNGKDIKTAKDMKVGIKEGSQYEEDIKQLAENPFIFHFEQEGEFPGEMQVEITVDKEDGEYLFMKYNQQERKADYIQKVTVKDKKTKFIVSEGGDYFIDKRVKTKSLNEKKEEIKEKSLFKTPEKEDEVMVAGTKKETNPVVIAVASVIILGAAAGGVWYYYLRKKTR
ncbi:MAG: cell surface protein [Lachnospiraceae bacterium]|nr:cell surface protein [Lachnospiraceae bacterium]